MTTWIYFLLIAATLGGGCKKNSGYTYGAETPPVDVPPVFADTTPRQYLALGDSYTIGQSVADSLRYPVQAVKLLRKDSVNAQPPRIVAVTGWTTTDLLNRLASSPPGNNYDWVTLLIGVNNQYRGWPQSQYRAEFTQLLRQSIAYAGNRNYRVVVLSIPDYSVTPFAALLDRALIARQIDSFNTINQQVTQSFGAKYVDVTPSSRMAAADPSLIAADSLHFSGKEYAKWATLLAPVLKQALR
jgi:lysophospholipase L1-like esterase